MATAAVVSANLVDIVSQINSSSVPRAEKKKSVKKTPAAVVVNITAPAPKPVKRLAVISKSHFSKTLKFYTDDPAALGNTADVVLMALKEAVASRVVAPVKQLV